MKRTLVSTTALAGIVTGYLGLIGPVYAAPTLNLSPTSFRFGPTTDAAVLVGRTAFSNLTITASAGSSMTYSSSTLGFSLTGPSTITGSGTPVRAGSYVFTPTSRASGGTVALTAVARTTSPSIGATTRTVTVTGVGVAPVAHITSGASDLTSGGTVTLGAISGSNGYTLVGGNATKTVVITNTGNGSLAGGANSATNPIFLNSSGTGGTAGTGYWTGNNYGGTTGAVNSSGFTGSGVNMVGATSTTASIAGLTDSASTTLTYTYAPTVVSGTVTPSGITGASQTSQAAVLKFYNGNPGAGTNATQDNKGYSSTISLKSQGVAAVADVAFTGVNTTIAANNYALVGSNLNTGTITVTNLGNGNLAGGANSVSNPINLNSGGTGGTAGSGYWAGQNFGGTTGIASGQVTGSGTTFSLSDSASQALTYTVAPTTTGAGSQAVTFDFFNGKNDGTNQGFTTTSTVSWVGVAPQLAGVTGGLQQARMGAGAQNLGVTVTNNGNGNLSGLGSVSNLNGTVTTNLGTTATAGHISGTGGSFSVQDSSTGTINYTYLPTVGFLNSGDGHGFSSTKNIAFATSNGSGATNASTTGVVSLTGQSVGPIYDSSVRPYAAARAGSYGSFATAVADVPPIPPGSISPRLSSGLVNFGKFLADIGGAESLTIRNASTDPGNLALTGLTILNAQLTGAQASYFSIDPAFTSQLGTLELGEGMQFFAGLTFNGAPSPGLYSATLAIQTDENAAFGAEGDIFYYTLVAQVLSNDVPEPGTLALMGLGLAGVAMARRRRRQS